MLIVGAALVALSFAFHNGKFQITEGVYINYFTLSDIFKEEPKQQYADISKIITNNKLLTDSVQKIILQDTLKFKKELNLNAKLTTIKKTINNEKILKDNKFNADSLKKILQKIEFPNDNPSVLYSFFKEITYKSTSDGPIRVLHYGDSQIEGDRISSILRNRLQFYFGGCGVGLIPAVTDNFNSMSVLHSSSGNWNIYKSFGPRGKTSPHRRFGALLSYSKFSPINAADTTIVQGWITLKKSSISYESVKKYKQCRLFCGYNNNPAKVELYSADKLLQTEYIAPNKNLQVLKFNFNDALSEITLKFKGAESPDIYGVALDDADGIAVDNIPLRGSSGLEFTRSDLGFLKSMYSALNVKLLILQFGVNVIPNVTSNYDYYEKSFYEQLSTLKRICPDISIVVIGVSDMSRKENGKYVSYPNVELVRTAQKNAAFKAGCAFWDMYSAMGGKNSMPGWVFAKPSLARTDFTHFTPMGAKIIAEMFYNALVLEYLDYSKNSKNNQAGI